VAAATASAPTRCSQISTKTVESALDLSGLSPSKSPDGGYGILYCAYGRAVTIGLAIGDHAQEAYKYFRDSAKGVVNQIAGLGDEAFGAGQTLAVVQGNSAIEIKAPGSQQGRVKLARQLLAG
jgi:hypothetical protein